jgi:hypothetical protein
VRLPIVKKTPKRIYYTHPAGPCEFQVKYVDRQQLEQHGSVSAPSSDYFELFADPPELGPPEWADASSLYQCRRSLSTRC